MASNIEKQILHADSAPNESAEQIDDFLGENLSKLKIVSLNLRVYGLSIVFFSFLCLGLTVLLAIGKSIFTTTTDYSNRTGAYETYLTGSGEFQATSVFVFLIIFEVINFFLIVLYDNRLKQGNAIFEEISDELQWNINKTSAENTSTSPTAERRPELETRILLRTYARTTDLPLFPGKYGPALYIFLGIISFFLSAFFYNLLIK